MLSGMSKPIKILCHTIVNLISHSSSSFNVKKYSRTVKSRELGEERRQTGVVFLRTQLFKWLSHLLLCLLCVTCTLWRWKKKKNKPVDIYRHLLRCSLMAESKRWKGRLDNQKAGSHAGLITHNICILNCHLTCD